MRRQTLNPIFGCEREDESKDRLGRVKPPREGCSRNVSFHRTYAVFQRRFHLEYMCAARRRMRNLAQNLLSRRRSDTENAPLVWLLSQIDAEADQPRGLSNVVVPIEVIAGTRQLTVDSSRESGRGRTTRDFSDSFEYQRIIQSDLKPVDCHVRTGQRQISSKIHVVP